MYILSMGLWCLASELIRKSGLKKKSYVFDWWFVNEDMICNFLDGKNDFDDIIYDEDGYMTHSKYGNIFIHQNDLNHDNVYLQKKVSNFLAIEKSENIIFVLTIHDRKDINIDRIVQKLNKNMYTNYKLLIFVQSFNNNNVEEIHNKRVKIYNILTDKEWIGTNWNTNECECDLMKIMMDIIHENVNNL